MSEIKIGKCKISGIKNPMLEVEIESSIDFGVEVLVDGEAIDYFIKRVGNKMAGVYAIIPKNGHVVELNIFKGNELIISKTVKNSAINRLFDRIYSTIYRILHKIWIFFKLLFTGIKRMWNDYHFIVPPAMLKKYWQGFVLRLKNNNSNFAYQTNSPSDYRKWLKDFEEMSDYHSLSYNPLISVVIPVYNIEPKYLDECISSILNQHYQNFEICLADDASNRQETIDCLKKWESTDERIKVVYRSSNGNISKCTNSAIEIAKGDYIAFMDNDDVIPENALYEMVLALNNNQDIDLIYTDEDKLDMNGLRCEPHFKPDYSPDTLLSFNYICHFVLVRRIILDKVGLLDSQYDGAQDYDLLLRIVEVTNNIYHIPKILYHWRKIAGSTAESLENKNSAILKGKMAVEAALKRRKIEAKVTMPMNFTYYIPEYLYEKEPKISIIIPTKDHVDILKKCLDSIYTKTLYHNYEILICDNNSEEEKTKEYLEQLKKDHENLKVIPCNFEFNYSKINNLAVKEAKGEYIVLLNNDTEIITPKWLSIMVGYAMQKHIGVVGVKLLYPDMTVQHAGVVLGLGGVASHVYIGATKDNIGEYGRLLVPYNYSASTAACLMVKKSIYNEVNGLEEDLKVAYNDIDFNIKVLKQGYYNVILPQVELMHYESKSRGLDTTGEKYKRFKSEERYMYNKWGGTIYFDKYYNPNYSKKGWFVLDKKEKK